MNSWLNEHNWSFLSGDILYAIYIAYTPHNASENWPNWEVWNCRHVLKTSFNQTMVPLHVKTPLSTDRVTSLYVTSFGVDRKYISGTNTDSVFNHTTLAHVVHRTSQTTRKHLWKKHQKFYSCWKMSLFSSIGSEKLHLVFICFSNTFQYRGFF